MPTAHKPTRLGRTVDFSPVDHIRAQKQHQGFHLPSSRWLGAVVESRSHAGQKKKSVTHHYMMRGRKIFSHPFDAATPCESLIIRQAGFETAVLCMMTFSVGDAGITTFLVLRCCARARVVTDRLIFRRSFSNQRSKKLSGGSGLVHFESIPQTRAIRWLAKSPRVWYISRSEGRAQKRTKGSRSCVVPLCCFSITSIIDTSSAPRGPRLHAVQDH